MKKFFTVLLLLAIVTSIFFGCNKLNDDDYVLKIQVGKSEYSINKKEIKNLAVVEKDKKNPVYSSDKTDDEGNPIPNTVKGTYLNNILAYLKIGSLADFNVLTVKSVDEYEKSIPKSDFDDEEVIIAYEYNKIKLSPQEKSGALRLVIPNTEANNWCKQIKTIILSNETLNEPKPKNLHILETLGSENKDSYQEDGYDYSGFSIAKLKENGIYSFMSTDIARVCSVDQFSNGNEIKNTITMVVSSPYSYFSDAFFILEHNEYENNLNTPMFVKPNPIGSDLKGMKRKNMLYTAINESIVLSMKIAEIGIENHELIVGENKYKAVKIKDILLKLKMEFENISYQVVGNTTETLQYEDIFNAYIYKSDNQYNIIVKSEDNFMSAPIKNVSSLIAK